MVTSNHIHLLVVDDGDRYVIPRSIQLIAGRTAQEYNQRKGRKGAFWEDRYHATAVESGSHLLHCLVYIDLNMVRAGVVAHPSEWSFSGYREIQEPRRKFALIAYERLRELAGFDLYNHFQTTHRDWIHESLGKDGSVFESRWSRGIAVGSVQFVEKTKEELGIRAKGRKVLGHGEGYQLRESPAYYTDSFGIEKEDIEAENEYFWNTNLTISI
jgi:putative transposase